MQLSTVMKIALFFALAFALHAEDIGGPLAYRYQFYVSGPNAKPMALPPGDYFFAAELSGGASCWIDSQKKAIHFSGKDARPKCLQAAVDGWNMSDEINKPKWLPAVKEVERLIFGGKR